MTNIRKGMIFAEFSKENHSEFETDFRKELAANMKAARLSAGLGIREMSRQTGITITKINRIERATHPIAALDVALYSRVTGKNIYALYGKYGDSNFEL